MKSIRSIVKMIGELLPNIVSRKLKDLAIERNSSHYQLNYTLSIIIGIFWKIIQNNNIIIFEELFRIEKNINKIIKAELSVKIIFVSLCFCLNY